MLLAGGVAAFLVVGVWGYVLNLVHTGHVLGHGQGRVDQSVSPSVVTVTHTFARVVYRMLDLALVSNRQIWWLACAGIAAGVVVAVVNAARAGSRGSLAATVATVARAALVLGLAPVVAWSTRLPAFRADPCSASRSPRRCRGLLGFRRDRRARLIGAPILDRHPPR